MSNFKALAETFFTDHIVPAAKEAMAAYSDGELDKMDAVRIVFRLAPAAMREAARIPVPNKGGGSKRELVGGGLQRVFTDLLRKDNPLIPNFIEHGLDSLLIACLPFLCDLLWIVMHNELTDLADETQ